MLNVARIRLRSALLAALFGVVGLTLIGSPASAAFVNLNPTGDSSGPTLSIGGIDFAPGNALAVGSLPLTVGKTFQLVYQSSVSGFVNAQGVTSAPSGLNTSYQITAVASFTEVVQSVNGASATFALAANQSAGSFFEMYYNPAVVANSLAGTGYNQGTLILSGQPATALASVGIFSLATDPSGKPILKNLDEFGTNHYPGVQTVSGFGSSLLATDVTYQNSNFFKSPLNEISFNSSLVTSFAQTSPSSHFIGHADGMVKDIKPDIGSVNGLNGNDFQFQADANLSFNNVSTFVVPEPASILVTATGLLGAFGLLARRKASGEGDQAPLA